MSIGVLPGGSGGRRNSDTASTVTLSSVSTTTTTTAVATPILNSTVDVKVKDPKDPKPLKIKLK